MVEATMEEGEGKGIVAKQQSNNKKGLLPTIVEISQKTAIF